MIATCPSTALERTPGLDQRSAGYTTKVLLEFAPSARSDGVVADILLALLDILQANVEGARANQDSEYLHDLRVAVRRTRTLLGQMQGVFPGPDTTHFRERFAWLQQVTGPVRDLDVYLARFASYRTSLPESLRDDLEPLRGLLLARHTQEQCRLAATLGASDFTGLLDDWRSFLTSPRADARAAPQAGRPIKELVDARIRRTAKRVRREGRALTTTSPPEELHQLRKRCKKLRYLMELFSTLYPPEQLAPQVMEIKGLLEQLGEFQDLTVQVGQLEDWAGQLHATGTGPRTLMATGALVATLLARQTVVREDFAHTFSTFDQGRRWREYKVLFQG